jgi:hypothetical protein
VHPTDPQLIRLLTEKYIPVRLTSLKGIDLNTFSFDYDLTFTGLVMTPEGATITRWGTRTGDEDATARLPLTGLVSVLQSALSAPRPKVERIPPQTIADKYPLFAQSKRNGEACWHCHYAHDAEVQQQRASGKFVKTMLYRYPLPESIGVTLDATAGEARIESATVAGLRAGDIIETANGQRVYTTADLQRVLDPLPDSGAVVRLGLRGGKKVTLRPKAGWRVSDISWRPSQGLVPPIIGIWEQPLSEEEKAQRGIAPKMLALKVTFLFPGAKWKRVQGDLRLNDVIVRVDGKTLPHMTPRQFHTWFRMNKKVGETATLTVLRGERKVDIAIPCLDLGDLE